MARSLVQALEGISFPCDRSRLIEYARTNDAAAKAMDSLTAIPEGEYRNMSDVLAAIPSKEQMRRRTVVRVRQTAREAEPRKEQPRPESKAEARPKPQQPEPERQAAQEGRKLAEDLWPGPATPDDMNPWTASWTWASNYVRLWQRFWFPWMR